MTPLLDIRGLRAGYAGVPVLQGIDLALEQGSFGVILGSNGAGKTTTLRSILSLAQVLGGTIELDGASLVGKSTASIVARGVAMVPEGRQLFSTLSVEENLVTGSLVGAGRRVQ